MTSSDRSWPGPPRSKSSPKAIRRRGPPSNAKGSWKAPGSDWPLSPDRRSGDRRQRRAQAQQVALGTEPANLAPRDLAEHRVVTKRLARMDVRHVDLDDRHGQDRQCIAD